MSYEGYYQLICTRGHLWEMDCYQYEFAEAVQCPHCKGEVAWEHSVNTTNDLGDPVVLDEICPESSCICPTCNKVHIASHAQYDIPLGLGHIRSNFCRACGAFVPPRPYEGTCLHCPVIGKI